MCRPLLCCTVASLAAALAACGSDVTAPSMASAAGTYALRSVGGRPLPTAIKATSSTTTVLRAARTLQADGTCSYSGRYHSEDTQGRVPPSDYDLSGTCTWALAGAVVTFRSVESGVAVTTTATLSGGNTLTEADPYGADVGPLSYVK